MKFTKTSVAVCKYCSMYTTAAIHCCVFNKYILIVVTFWRKAELVLHMCRYQFLMHTLCGVCQ